MDYELLERRIVALEAELDVVKKHLQINDQTQSSNKVHRNEVGQNMVKIVYPGIFAENPPTAGYPRNRRVLAMQHKPGQEMAMYVTSPHKVIIGVARVTGPCTQDPTSQWPYQVPIEWTIGPKPGVTLKEAELDVRPRVGDTVFSIGSEDMGRIKDLLSKQPDLNEDMRILLSQRGDK